MSGRGVASSSDVDLETEAVAGAILLGRLRPAGRVEIAMSASIFQKNRGAIAREASDRMPAELRPDADETFNRLAKKISEGIST